MCVCVCWTICIAWHMRFWPDASRCSPLEVNQQKKKDSFPAKRFTNDRRRLGCCTFDRAHGISHKRHTTKRNFRIRARGLFDSFYGNRKQQQKKKRKTCAAFNEKKAHEKKKVKQKKPGFFPSSFIYVHWSFFVHSFRFFLLLFWCRATRLLMLFRRWCCCCCSIARVSGDLERWWKKSTPWQDGVTRAHTILVWAHPFFVRFCFEKNGWNAFMHMNWLQYAY